MDRGSSYNVRTLIMPITPETTPPPNLFFGLLEVLWVGFAMVGGIAHHLDAYLRGGDFPSFKRLIANAVVSGFSGYMMALVALRVAPDWAYISAGIGGYLGTQGIDWVASILRGRISQVITPVPPTPPEQPK
jgi:hypothetical protein